MTAIRAAAALLALCSVSVPGMAQNGRPVPPTLPPSLQALPPPNAIPGTLDLATRQFTPLIADTTRPTIINKVYTFTPDFKQIQAEAAVIHTVTCYMFIPIVSSVGFANPQFSGYATASNQFDLENPPTALSVHVFYSVSDPRDVGYVKLGCDALDENNENHSWFYYTDLTPLDKLPVNYHNSVIF